MQGPSSRSPNRPLGSAPKYRHNISPHFLLFDTKARSGVLYFSVAPSPANDLRILSFLWSRAVLSLHGIRFYMLVPMYGIVCGPSGRTHIRASSLQLVIASSMLSTGVRCA